MHYNYKTKSSFQRAITVNGTAELKAKAGFLTVLIDSIKVNSYKTTIIDILGQNARVIFAFARLSNWRAFFTR